jgi:hypothetical protein
MGSLSTSSLPNPTFLIALIQSAAIGKSLAIQYICLTATIVAKKACWLFFIIVSSSVNATVLTIFGQHPPWIQVLLGMQSIFASPHIRSYSSKDYGFQQQHFELWIFPAEMRESFCKGQYSDTAPTIFYQFV